MNKKEINIFRFEKERILFKVAELGVIREENLPLDIFNKHLNELNNMICDLYETLTKEEA